MAKRIYRILTATLIFVAIYHVFTLGYGCADEIQYVTEKTVTDNADYANEHLLVIYERQIGNETDLVQLQIDTTYHKIGKGAYQHEILCNREFSLSSFDGEYHNMSDAVAACFVGNNNSWNSSDTHPRQIMDYECQRATKLINNEPYEAWYTDALPYHRPKSRVMDEMRGLVLEARSAKGDYTLKVKYIGEQIG